jgi:hypothetical protein
LRTVLDADLNAAAKSMRVSFDSVTTDQIMIRQTGLNWIGKQFFNVGKIEILSPDPKFARGVCRALFRQHRQDIQKFVEVRARDFDLENLHRPDNPTNVCTGNEGSQWVQMEIVGAQFVTTCYRLKRGSKAQLRSWSLRGSNGPSLPLDKWTVIDRRTEEKQGDYNEFDTFPAIGGPFKYFRIVSDGRKWDDKLLMTFKHIDMYGLLVPD